MRDEPPSTGRPDPSRRDALRLGGAGVVALLAGCTEDVGEEFPPNEKTPVSEVVPELPVQERTDVAAERIEEMADAEIDDEGAFAAAFDDYALEVESVEREREVLRIEYVNTSLYEEGNLHDVAPIAGAYASLIDAGDESVALAITILDPAPASFGAAEVEMEWAEAYNEGELTAKEYGELVAATIESKRHPPEVGVTPDE